ncbi:MAG: thermonuclease family protein [Candidatus Bipolaricaulota bacterium]|nr:thermonuclease family protein [Candidatus Bipolaricaulota bacterium]
MRRRLRLPASLVLVVLLAGFAFGDTPDPANATIDSRVLKIVDGDTVDIRGSTRVRYLNIDTPEIGQPYADEATSLNKSLVQFKNVRLELDVKERDAYSRLLAYVYVETDTGWVMANLEIVRAGLARLLIIPPNGKYRAEFEAAQLDAMIHRRGLWSAVGGIVTVPELEAEIGDAVNQVVTVRFTVSGTSTSARGTRVDPAEATALGFHLLLTPDCAPIALDPGVEILATGILEYSSLKSGPQISIDDPTQIVFTRDLETAVPSP